MGLPLRKLAMKLLFFQILALNVEVVSNFTPDEDQVAIALKVAHFDCSEMTENTPYALNQEGTQRYKMPSTTPTRKMTQRTSWP